jgi:hypothetical protein
MKVFLKEKQKVLDREGRIYTTEKNDYIESYNKLFDSQIVSYLKDNKFTREQVEIVLELLTTTVNVKNLEKYLNKLIKDKVSTMHELTKEQIQIIYSIFFNF